MGVNIISSSRAEVEFEECLYCHSESAVKHEYITDARGGWDVVKYTCLKCASQFIYNCREARPHPILVQVPGDSWPFRYTTESEVWRELLGYKQIEKPKEETVEDKSIIKFKVDEFDAAIAGCRIGDTMKFNGKTYVAMDQLDYDNGCYECGLCQECQDLHHGEFATDICNINVIFKEKEEEVKESTSDDLAIFYDYSKDDFEHLFNFRVGFKFRYGNKMYEVAEVAKAPTTEFHCEYDCALYEECRKKLSVSYTEDCPSNIYFKECCTKKQFDDKQEPAKKENKPMAEASKMRDYSTGDFAEIFKLNDGDEFRFGDSIYKAMSKNPSKWAGCDTDCDLYDYCYDEDGALCLDACPGSRYCKKLGYAFNRCPDCGEYALKVCLNAAPEGVTKHVLNVSMVPGDDGIPDIDKQELEHMTNAAAVVCTHCGKRQGTFGSWRAVFKPVHSFIDDGDKLVDFFKLSKEEFLKSYSYLTEEEPPPQNNP